MKRVAFLEDSIRVPEDVKRVQRELDEAHFAREFEETVGAMGRGIDDPVFGDRVALYAWGELEYKRGDGTRIMPNPMHECSKERGCKMKRIEVRVYRRNMPMGSAVPDVGCVRSIGDAVGPGSQMRMYHLCFPASCEHLQPNHVCRMTPHCWHAIRDAPSDTLVLEDFWVCAATGNLHVCGSLCTQRKIVTAHENDHVCPLTGTVVASRRAVSDWQGASDRGDTRALLCSSAGPAPGDDTAAAREKRQKAVSMGSRSRRSGGPMWGPGGEEAEYMLFAERLADELFFSKTRQMIEAEKLLSGIDAAFNDVVKFMRVRSLVDETPQRVALSIRLLLEAQTMVGGQGGLHHDANCMSLIRAGEALCVYHNRIPVSEYFANVPMMDDIAAYFVRRRAEIETKNLDTDRRQPSDIAVLRQFQFHDREATAAAAAAARDYASFLHRTVTRVREDANIVRPKITRWNSDEWARRRKDVTALYAHTLVRVWKNMRTYCTTPEGRDTLTFGRIALGMIYLTKSSLSVQDMSVAPCESYVTVVPRIEFSQLLPCDNQIEHFDLATFAAAPGARRLTTIQGDIRREAMKISVAGNLPSLLLRLQDVMNGMIDESKRRDAAPRHPAFDKIAVGRRAVRE